MCATDVTKLFRLVYARKASKVTRRIFVGALGARVRQVGEPFHLGRHISQLVKLAAVRSRFAGGTWAGGWSFVGFIARAGSVDRILRALHIRDRTESARRTSPRAGSAQARKHTGPSESPSRARIRRAAAMMSSALPRSIQFRSLPRVVSCHMRPPGASLLRAIVLLIILSIVKPAARVGGLDRCSPMGHAPTIQRRSGFDPRLA